MKKKLLFAMPRVPVRKLQSETDDYKYSPRDADITNVGIMAKLIARERYIALVAKSSSMKARSKSSSNGHFVAMSDSSSGKEILHFAHEGAESPSGSGREGNHAHQTTKSAKTPGRSGKQNRDNPEAQADKSPVKKKLRFVVIESEESSGESDGPGPDDPSEAVERGNLSPASEGEQSSFDATREANTERPTSDNKIEELGRHKGIAFDGVFEERESLAQGQTTKL